MKFSERSQMPCRMYAATVAQTIERGQLSVLLRFLDTLRERLEELFAVVEQLSDDLDSLDSQPGPHLTELKEESDPDDVPSPANTVVLPGFHAPPPGIQWSPPPQSQSLNTLSPSLLRSALVVSATTSGTSTISSTPASRS